MTGKNFLATATGLLFAFLIVFFFYWAGMTLFPHPNEFKPTTQEEWEELMMSFPIGSLLFVALGHGIGVFVGGLIANRIDKNSIMGYLVIFLLMFVITGTNALAYPHPLWFKITDVSMVVTGGFLAWRYLKWK